MRLAWRDGAAAVAVTVAGRPTWSTGDRMTEMDGAGERDHTPVWPVAAATASRASALGVG